MKKLNYLPGLLALTMLFSGIITCNAKSKPGTIGKTDPGIQLMQQGDDLVAFQLNAEGRVTDYFLVQGANSSWNIPGAQIKSVQYTRGSDIRMEGSDGTTYFFNILGESSTNGSLQKFAVYGIAHYRSLASEGIDLATATDIVFMNLGGTGGCDESCLSGGCGAISCSRKIWQAECDVSCSGDRFACCGDLVSKGCKCEPAHCCKGSKN